MADSEFKVDASFTESLDYKISKANSKIQKAKARMSKYKSQAETFSTLSSLSLPDYKLKRKFDEVTGKVSFELESGERKIPLPKANLAKRAARKVYFKANSFVHNKISEGESDNQAVEAFHKGELQLEDLGNKVVSYIPSADVVAKKIKREMYKKAKAAEGEYNKSLFEKEVLEGKHGNQMKEIFKVERENTTFKKGKAVGADIKKTAEKEIAKKEKERLKKLQKEQIKKQIKKKVVKEGAKKAGEEAGKGAVKTGAVVAEKSGEGILANIIGLATGVEEYALIAVAAIAIVIAVIAMIIIIVGMILSFIFFHTNVLGSMYRSDPTEIEQAELHMTYLEASLEEYLENIEDYVPDYDGYVIEADTICHNPFTLINYLSAKYGEFTYDDVESEIDDLYDACYTITTWVEETVEVVDPEPPEEGEEEEDDDEDDEEEEPSTVTYYTYHIKVTKKSLEEVVAGLMSDDEKEMYGVYWETHGGLQGLANPVGFDWYSSVSSYYGYRFHPIDNVMKLHRGVDIALEEGTSLYSGIEGVVTEIDFDVDGYGLYVVIKNDEGIVCKYAHMQATSGLMVGQTVSKGELIGYSGNTGKSTGPHLHMECMKDGVYYNPIFYFDSD